MAEQQIRAELAAVTQRLVLSEQQSVRLAEQMEKLTTDTDAALREANNKIVELDRHRGPKHEERMDLVDIKTMQPKVYSGKMEESYKAWAKKVKAFCNARKPGFRQALDWAELEVTPIDRASLGGLNWAAAELADSKLYDMLVLHLADDPLVLVENHPNQGFEAWRSLSRRYDPVGEQFTFDRMTALLSRDRCKNISELPAAIEKWTRDLSTYERKTGKTLEKEWRVPIIFQMIPKANYTEIKARWQLNKEKDITVFAQELVLYANDLKHEQARDRGPSAMDVDLLRRENEDWTEEEWEAHAAECQATIDWMGKGGGKGKKGGKGGKGDSKGKGKGCHWCGKPGHMKSECREFEKWKRDKDEERKKKGLPAFKPRGVALVEPGDGGNGSDRQSDDYEELLRGGVPAGMLDAGVGSLDLGVDSLDCFDNGMMDCNALDANKELDGDLECNMFDFDLMEPEFEGESEFNLDVDYGSVGPIRTIEIANRFNALSDEPVGKPRKPESLADQLYREQQELILKLSGSAASAGPRPRTPLIAKTSVAVHPRVAGVQSILSEFAKPSELPPPAELPLPPSSSGRFTRRNRVRPDRGILPRVQIKLADAFNSSRQRCDEGCDGGCDDQDHGASPRDLCLPKADDAVVPSTVKVRTNEMETQTDIQLAHCVRNITWIPMTDELNPVDEKVDDEDEEDGEDDKLHLEDDKDEVDDVNGVDSVDTEKRQKQSLAANLFIMCTLINMHIQAQLVSNHNHIEHEVKSKSESLGTDETELEDFELEDFVTDSEDFLTDSEDLENFELEDFDTDEEMLELVEESEDNLEDFELEDFETDSEDSVEIEEEFWDAEEEIWDTKENLMNIFGENLMNIFEEFENRKGNSSGKVESQRKSKTQKRNAAKRKGKLAKEEKEFDVNPLGMPKDETEGEMVMTAKTGKRARMRNGITMDSGSHHNVMPRRMVNAKRIRASEYSKRGIHYVAANKGKIPNEGETTFEFETLEGNDESWDFQIAEVNKALGSIADRVDNWNRVVFDKDMKTGRDVSYILDKVKKRATKMTRTGNVWKVDCIVNIENISNDASFARRG